MSILYPQAERMTLERYFMDVVAMLKRRPYNFVLTSCAGWDRTIFLDPMIDSTEKRLSTIPYIPVYGLNMPIYGSNLSQHGKIRDRIQPFFRTV